MNHLKLLFLPSQSPASWTDIDKKGNFHSSECLMDFCSVLNGIYSTLKSDNERVFPCFSYLHRSINWWTEVKFMCQVENISEYKGKTEEKSFNLYFIVFGSFLFISLFRYWYSTMEFFLRWKNYVRILLVSRIIVHLVQSLRVFSGKEIFGNKVQERWQEKSRLIGCFVTKWTLNTVFVHRNIFCWFALWK